LHRILTLIDPGGKFGDYNIEIDIFHIEAVAFGFESFPELHEIERLLRAVTLHHVLNGAR